MKKAIVIFAALALLAPLASADSWFGRIYGDQAGGYAGPDFSDRPAVVGYDLVDGVAPVVAGNSPQYQYNPIDVLTNGADDGGLVLGDFQPENPVSFTWEDTEGNWTPQQILTIRSFGGNADTRNWQNVKVQWKDSGGTWNTMFDSHNSGHLHAMIPDPADPDEPLWGDNIAAQFPGASKSLVQISNDEQPLVGGQTVHGLSLTYYLVSSWGSQIWPSQEEVNNGFDPTGTGAFADVTGSIIEEIDVIQVPEPASLMLLGVLALVRRR